jgi:transcriptional regulator with XRE-family HTH domain
MRDWLRNIRTLNKMTQIEVAEKAGIAQPYYAQIENGIRGDKLPVQTAQTIAAVLGFDWTRFYEKESEAR